MNVVVFITVVKGPSLEFDVSAVKPRSPGPHLVPMVEVSMGNDQERRCEQN